MTMEAAVTADFDTEQPVIEAIINGDHYAFDQFLRRQNRWVRGIVFAIIGDSDRVDDIVQQVWATVWQKISELRDVKLWRPWLYRLARNAAVDAGRETTRQKEFNGRLATEPPPRPHSPTPLADLMADERNQAMLGAIQGLPAIYREPFILRHLEDWSYKRIAEVLDMPVDTVETRLVRARRLLRQALSGRV